MKQATCNQIGIDRSHGDQFTRALSVSELPDGFHLCSHPVHTIPSRCAYAHECTCGLDPFPRPGKLSGPATGPDAVTTRAWVCPRAGQTRHQSWCGWARGWHPAHMCGPESLPSTSAWMALESVMLSEVSGWPVNDKQHVISPVRGI